MVIKLFKSEMKNLKWYATTIEGAEIISQAKLNNSDIKVLFYLLSKINEENRVYNISYWDIASAINLKESSVKKSMMALRQLSILTKDITAVKTIMINPTFFYAGNHTTNTAKYNHFLYCKSLYEEKQKNRKTKIKL